MGNSRHQKPRSSVVSSRTCFVFSFQSISIFLALLKAALRWYGGEGLSFFSHSLPLDAVYQLFSSEKKTQWPNQMLFTLSDKPPLFLSIFDISIVPFWMSFYHTRIYCPVLSVAFPRGKNLHLTKKKTLLFYLCTAAFSFEIQILVFLCKK